VNGALGSLLPLALGVAISPVPIMTAVLMLLAERSARTSVGYLLGWAAGVFLPLVVFTLIAGFIPSRPGDHPLRISGSLLIVIGFAITGYGIRQWSSRAHDASDQIPGWMNSLDSLTPKRAFSLALTLSMVNPKTLLLAASAGIIIHGADLGVVSIVVAFFWFTILGSLTIAIPVLAYCISPSFFAGPLERARSWLVTFGSSMMAALTFLLGIFVIVVGLRNL